MRTSLDYMQLRHDCVVIYEQSLENRTGYLHNLKGQKPYSGQVKATTSKRIEKAVDLLLQRSPTQRIYNPVRGGEHDFRINFITTTISDTNIIPAEEAYQKALKPFLRILRERSNVKDYIWKAELQQRGQVHYHITTNKFIHLDFIKTEWNKLQKKAGWLDGYARKHKNYNPNSTDVHAVWKVRNLQAYLSKYLAKTTQNNTKIKGKVWDCSNSLNTKRFTVELRKEHTELIDDAVQNNIAEVIKLERCIIVKMPEPALILNEIELTDYHQFLST